MEAPLCGVCQKAPIAGHLKLASRSQVYEVCQACFQAQHYGPEVGCFSCGASVFHYYRGKLVGSITPPETVLVLYCSEFCYRVVADDSVVHACEVCHAPARACMRCKMTYYCSRACQKADWKSHKPYCFISRPSAASTEKPYREGHCYYCESTALANKLHCKECNQRPEIRNCCVCNAPSPSTCAVLEGANGTHLLSYCSHECGKALYKGIRKCSSELTHLCCVCMKPGAKSCSKCSCTYYCSQECQRSDWPKHKIACPKMKQKTAPKDVKESTGIPEEVAPDP